MEHEIKKYARKILQIAKVPQSSFYEKMKDIIIEIIIIVVAVSISIALHNWNEERHNRLEEKEFLQGLKKDIQFDIQNMESSKSYYEECVQGLAYYLKIAKKPSVLNQDSVKRYIDIFFSSTDLDPHIERYEGLKNSGRFIIIKNKELLDNIINLHEIKIQRIHNLNKMYYDYQRQVEAIISQNIQITRGMKNISLLLHRSDLFLVSSLEQGLIVNNIIPVHIESINVCKNINAQIDEELK